MEEIKNQQLTSEGLALLYKRADRYKRSRGITASRGDKKKPWYQTLKQELLAQKYEGKYWRYIK